MKNFKILTAWNYIRRSPFQALAAIFVMANTFFVATILGMLIYSSNNVLKYFETKPQVIAFLKDNIKDEQLRDLQTKLQSDSRVKNVNYVSKEDALKIYQKSTADNPLLSELISPSIFPASIEFSLSDLSYAEGVFAEIKSSEIVDEIGFTASLGGENTLGDVVSKLRTVTSYIRIGGAVFISFLVGTSFLVLIVIISIRLTTRKTEIEILDLIGATRSFIRIPIMLEATIYSLIGVLLGWLGGFLLILYAAPSLIRYFAEIPVLPKNIIQLISVMGAILGMELLVGFLLSLVGSIFAVSRSYRKR